MSIHRETLRLYAVTGRAWAKSKEALLGQVASAIRGGARVVQLREKCLDYDALLEEAKDFTALCRRLGAVSIINDRGEIALESGADGVHVGQGDLEAGRARALLGPEKIVGVSVHSPEEARRAQAAGADYLGCGAAFPTGTKTGATPVSKETLRAVAAAVDIPVVAIGGINRENLLKLKGLGLAGVAVVSSIFGQRDVEEAARELRALARKL
ncbi:MAG: thiamine phosphate synthase [Oscillibacter sp.]|nr:thiamine phosphate synthase [Oscillibacter sp.]